METKIDKEGSLDEQYQINNRNLILIESCLRVTYTSPKNMHWIGQVLSELDKNEEVDIVRLLEQYASKKVKEAEYTKTTGFGIQRIVFNFLDYILAKNYEEYANYSFRFRNSIEHFYPQHPSEGEYWEDEDLNSNLEAIKEYVSEELKKDDRIHFAAESVEIDRRIPLFFIMVERAILIVLIF